MSKKKTQQIMPVCNVCYKPGRRRLGITDPVSLCGIHYNGARRRLPGLLEPMASCGCEVRRAFGFLFPYRPSCPLDDHAKLARATMNMELCNACSCPCHGPGECRRSIGRDSESPGLLTRNG